jgi:hypothetical protein
MRGLFQKVFGVLFGHPGDPSEDQKMAGTTQSSTVKTALVAYGTADTRMDAMMAQYRRSKSLLNTELSKLQTSLDADSQRKP